MRYDLPRAWEGMGAGVTPFRRDVTGRGNDRRASRLFFPGARESKSLADDESVKLDSVRVR
jgi:hypothetical protein